MVAGTRSLQKIFGLGAHLYFSIVPIY